MHEDEPTTGPVTTGGDQQQTVKADETVGGLLAPGERVGRYVVRERLGEGGFAEVYLAEQQEPVRRRVALKIIKLGMDTKQVIARFEAERQALAMMDHANVAKVFDAGSTETGRPYFVMEHVPGVSITEHCDRQRLSIQERLQLFMQVCDAVQHAHQKGIIHRDIKPSNVLVLIKDGTAIPKVIDFGVAKAISQRLTEKTIYTEQGQLIGTPEYMSPEQAEMTAQDIDTRSDIYSLGVLLYELLTGALPFDPTTLRKAAFAEIQRIIREQEPPKPSTRLSGLGDPSTGFAHKRRADPRSLLRELRGDLDWIVMKALEKDRSRRYETANGLALDIRRHLDHEPVLAGPPSAAYKLSKFVRRNRVTVAAGSVVALSLLAAVAVSVGFALSEAEQRWLAATERDTARAVNEFLNEDLLAAVAPSAEKGKGKDVLMRDVLDEAAKRIEDASDVGGRFEHKPLVEASIRLTLGFTYTKLGEYPAAEPHLERARQLWLRELGKEHPDTLMSMQNLAVLYWGQGRYDEAEPLQLETLEIRKRVLGEEHPSTLASMNYLAVLYLNQGRYDETEPLYLETLKISKRVLGEEHLETLRSMHNLAVLYRSQGRYDEAEQLYIQVLAMRKLALGEEHPETLISMNNLAVLYQLLGRYEAAEPLSLQTLVIKRRVLGDRHPGTLIAMNDLAWLYKLRGRYEQAESLIGRALEIYRDELGHEHPDTLLAESTLGAILLKAGRIEEAETLLRKLVAIGERVLGENHWLIPNVRAHHGMCLVELAHYEQAEPLLLETYPRLQPLPSDEAKDTIRYLAILYDALGKPEQAAEWRAKLPWEQEAVASDRPGQSSSDEKQDE